MLKFKKFTFNPFYENTYVAWDDLSKDAMIIDPGCHSKAEKNELQNFWLNSSLKVKYLVNTHCHIDHIFGCTFVKKNFGDALYFAPEEELPLLKNAKEQGLLFGMTSETPPMPDKYLSEKILLNIGKSEVKFIFTPGHSPGGYSIYFEKEKICITGDVLFKGNIGRTDLWGGDYKQLINSITAKLFTLPGDTVILPGHGDESSIDAEKKHNPFFR